MVNEKLIDNYLRNEMDDQEKELFRERLSTDQELRRMYKLTKDIAFAINESDVLQLRLQLDNIHKEMVNTDKVPVFTISRILKAAAVISGFILISSILFINRNYDNKEIYDKYFEPYESIVRVRAANNAGNLLSKAMNFYEEGKYTEAAQIFEVIVAADSNKMAVNLYSGLSNMEISEFEKADKSFNRILDHKNNPYVEPAEWYLAFCYLMTNDREKALISFDNIANSESYYNKKASKILKKLKK